MGRNLCIDLLTDKTNTVCFILLECKSKSCFGFATVFKVIISNVIFVSQKRQDAKNEYEINLCC